jgi:hypothetical protein
VVSARFLYFFFLCFALKRMPQQKKVRWRKSGSIRTNPGAMGLMGPMRFRNTVMEVFHGPITPGFFCHNGTSGDILFGMLIVENVFRGLHNGQIYPAPRYIYNPR